MIPSFLGTAQGGQPPPLNGFAWTEPACQLLKSMDWDAEVYGNPRMVNGRPDLGADETHAYIAAGSYGNDSVSHNLPATNLAPNAASGQSMRRLLLFGAASQNLVVINGKAVVPVGPTTAHPAWTQPPGTLTPPTVRGSLPQDLRTAWITFNNPAPVPTPWQNGTMPAMVTYVPPWINVLNQNPCQVCNLAQPDDESSVPPTVGTYFARQLVMILSVGGPQLGWSNLQFEYR